MKLIHAPSALVDRRTFYLGDYTSLSVREWAAEIHCSFGLSGKIPEFPIGFLRVVAKVGDISNRLLRNDWSPLTTFRLNNLICDMVYPQLSELENVTGSLPFSWREGTDKTVQWLKNS